MGGHAGGEFASAIAVNTVEEVLTSIEIRPNAEDFEMDESAGPVEVVREKLRYSIRLAGQRIYRRAQIGRFDLRRVPTLSPVGLFAARTTGGAKIVGLR